MAAAKPAKDLAAPAVTTGTSGFPVSGCSVVLALIEVVAILLNVTDKLASVVNRVVDLAARSVTGDLLVALLVLVVRVVAAAVLADLELVPGIIVTFARRTKVVLTNHLPLGASRAVDLRSTVVAVADDDNTGRDNRENSCNSLGGNLTALGEGNGGSGGGSRQSLGDEVGVDNGIGLAGVDTDGDVDGEENVDVNALAAHDSRAGCATTTVKIAATVASIIEKTEEVGASTLFGTLVGIVIFASVSKGEAGETIVRETAKEVEADWVSDASSSSAGGSSGGLSASGLGTDGSGSSSSLSLESCGGSVCKASGGELGGGHIAHGQGKNFSVAHLESRSIESD
ncbi:hypothetical protein HG531_000879 [Fusarium graminearum]|nr:hypothetical protein HG531_000879 [Fusarium graminearum]